jgi:hypothetical protein
MPEVALVELPPKKSAQLVSTLSHHEKAEAGRTVLVEDEHIATIQVDSVRSAEAREATADNNDTRRGHGEQRTV